VIFLAIKVTYKITGIAVLIVGMLFFLRDLGVNYIGNTSGWTILIVLLGTGLLAGDFELKKFTNQTQQKRAVMKGIKK
jgi:hypothetical protein